MFNQLNLSNMKNDLFKKLSDTAEIEYLQQQELKIQLEALVAALSLSKTP